MSKSKMEERPFCAPPEDVNDRHGLDVFEARGQRNQCLRHCCAPFVSYYLDFYNNKYNVNHTRLDEFSDGVIREIFSYYKTDPVKKVETSIGDMPSIPKASFKKLAGNTMEEKLITAGMNNIHEYIMSEYSKICNYTVTTYDNLCEEAEKDFFSSAGMELDSHILETEEEILSLAYDYFYNKLLSYDLDHSVGNLTYKNNTEHYSIGEYMRNEGKADNIIINSFGVLEPGNTYELNETLIKIPTRRAK